MAAVAGRTPHSGVAVEVGAEVQQPAALGVHRSTGRGEGGDVGDQRGVGRQRGDVLLREAAGQHERRRAVGQALVVQRVDDGDVEPRGREQFDVLGVAEGERRTPRDRHHRPG